VTAGILDDLAQRWAEEAAERAELDGAWDIDDHVDDVDPTDALERLHREADDDQPIVWRRP
jgi:hypothetical protein